MITILLIISTHFTALYRLLDATMTAVSTPLELKLTLVIQIKQPLEQSRPIA